MATEIAMECVIPGQRRGMSLLLYPEVSMAHGSGTTKAPRDVSPVILRVSAHTECQIVVYALVTLDIAQSIVAHWRLTVLQKKMYPAVVLAC